MTHFLVLASPDAGGMDGELSPELQKAVNVLERAGTVTVTQVDSAKALRRATQDLPDDTTFVIAGGDGSLHHSVNGLREMGRPFGLIPGGTGNDFARGSGVPEDMERAAQLLVANAPGPYDVVTISGESSSIDAVNAAHLGIGVQAAQAAADWKEGLGKLAYPAGALSAARTFDPEVVTMNLDGKTILDEEAVALVAVCNGRFVGGGTELCPAADPCDGQFDVVVMRADTRTKLAVISAALLNGTHLDRDDVWHGSGTDLEVIVHDTDTVTWNIDGELTDLSATVRATIDADAWQLAAAPTTS